MSRCSHGGTARAILYTLLANSGIAVAKSWAAWLTASASMPADAIHSYVDAGNQVLLSLGLRPSTRPPDPEHPEVSDLKWCFIEPDTED